ncbi:MAG TPA: hypothetical protein VKQ28_02245 [Candidatus Acidoferrum sp.]|nr:hypothetical protein [Candidatus Acidoferrum sp.]
MPKWVAYCRLCNRPSAYREIDPEMPALVTLFLSASPAVRKPALPQEGDRWLCPFCKKASNVKPCDLTFSYA